MKILLSAYACEPNKGSEPGIGWNWALEIAAKGNLVWVITRRNNRFHIEANQYNLKNIKFIYYDLPDKLLFIKKYLGVNLYYMLWQIKIYFVAKNFLKKERVDIIHHITFGSIKKISFLGYLGLPFYIGPIGGGEAATFELIRSLALFDQFKEIIRYLINLSAKFNPLILLTLLKAKKIFVTTDQSKQCISKHFRHKCIVAQAAGLNSFKYDSTLKKFQIQDGINFLYVGRFLPWKGIHLSLMALQALKLSGEQFKFTIVGQGNNYKQLIHLVKVLDLQEHIKFINWVNYHELQKIYTKNDIFLFPSFHDSGGMAVLEAMSYGLPVLCLNIGGPSIFVNSHNGYIVNVRKKSLYEILNNFKNILLNLKIYPQLLKDKSINSQISAQKFTWKENVSRVYEIIENDFRHNT